jgi:hypothetical protein
MTTRIPIAAALFAACWAVLSAPPTAGCPFCKVTVQTLGERMAAVDVVVVAKLASTPAPPDGEQSAEQATFQVLRVLKDKAVLGDSDEIATYYFGESKPGTTFLLLGTHETELLWAVPVPLTKRAVDYLVTSLDLPAEGRQRLAFFQDYLEDEDPLLAWDAYEEFARASYGAVEDLKTSMDHGRLITWIQDSEVPPNRRRLYLTMLGVCGTSSDTPLLAEMLSADQSEVRTGLDAMIACYLKLKGPAGLPLIEDLFLKNRDAEFADTYAAVSALRFIEGQTDTIPRDRIIQAYYLMLDRPELADLVVADLARWEDWSVMPRLVELFKNADEDTSWLRQPIARYLMECPLPEAKQYLKELRSIDAEAIERASSVQAQLAGRARGGEPTAGEGEQDAEPAEARPNATEPRTEPPSVLTVLGIPLMAGVFLFAVIWFVLGGAGTRRAR